MRRACSALLVLLVGVCVSVAQAHPTQPLDRDHDGISNQDDICPDAFDINQLDTDHDGTAGFIENTDPTHGGDACDTDDDGDAIDDAVDVCPLIADPEQRDTDADGIGDLCDEDDDADGIRDQDDNCIKVGNPDQADQDGDFIGDVCDPQTPKAPKPVTVAGVVLGRPDAKDKVAPVLKLRAPASASRAELAAGLPVPMSCSEACGVTLSRGVGAGLSGAGSTFLIVRVRGAAAGRLRLRGSVRDASGNHRAVSLTLRVTR